MVTTPTKHHALVKPYSPKRRQVITGVSIGIILVVIVPIILIAVFGSISFIDIGEIPFDVDSFAITNIDLNIDNSVGSVDIEYDNTMTKLFESTINVKGRPGASIDDAQTFGMVIEPSRLVIEFNSGDYGFFFWNKKAFTYNILIKLHPSAIVNFDVDADTGSVSLTTTGVDNIEFGNIYLVSDNGRVTLDMSGSGNASIQDLFLDSDTGRISVDLGERTTLNTTDVNITTSTGGITFSYTDLIVTDDIFWAIHTSTGSINMFITQLLVLPYDLINAFDVHTSTGSIAVSFLFNSSIGYRFDGSSDTGSVDLLGEDDYYQSALYLTASNVYGFTLDTNTGSVTAEEL